jgi:NagD protein
MDGVIYRGSDVIPGAIEFIAALRENEIPFLFLTNNSSRTQRDVATKLVRMGFDVEERHIYTCAMATASFLARQKPMGTAFVIGEGGLLNALYAQGYSIVDHDPDYVVIGEGRSFNFEMVETAVMMVCAGAKLVATNPDPNCPTPEGIRPGCGAIAAMIETATGVKSASGTESHYDRPPEDLGLSADETTMIGDTMETDILGAVNWAGPFWSSPAVRKRAI